MHGPVGVHQPPPPPPPFPPDPLTIWENKALNEGREGGREGGGWSKAHYAVRKPPAQGPLTWLLVGAVYFAEGSCCYSSRHEVSKRSK